MIGYKTKLQIDSIPNTTHTQTKAAILSKKQTTKNRNKSFKIHKLQFKYIC